MPGVFISYRREDTTEFAGALLRELNTRIGGHVFMDIEDISGGTDFPSVLKEAVQSCYVLLAVIGPHWLVARNTQGGYRLDDPSDFVRQEILLALQAEARVIPVLVEGAQMPGADRLPLDLQPLATLNAVQVSDTHWDEDVARLTDHIREGLYTLGANKRNAEIAPDFAPPIPHMTRGTKVLVGAAFGLAFIFGVIEIGAGMKRADREARSLAAGAKVIEMVEQKSERGKRMYYPGLQFLTKSGQTVRFTDRSGSSRPEYKVGQTVSILYDPEHPEQAFIDTLSSRWNFTFIFSVLALGSLLGAVWPLWDHRIQHSRMRRLLNTGIRVTTSFHAVEENKSVTVKGRHPYVVLTEWRNPVSRELVHFRSHPVWEDPTSEAMKRKITVIVDPGNFRRYVMDLAFLETSRT